MRYKIRPEYKPIPLTGKLRPAVEPPSELGTLLLVFLCSIVIVLAMVGVLG